MDSLGLLGSLALTAVVVIHLDFSLRRRGLVPPRFMEPGPGGTSREAALRRTSASLAVALVLYLGVFAPLGLLAGEPPDPSGVETPQLFVLHSLFAAALAAWYVLGFLPHRGVETSPWAQFGLRATSVPLELGFGLVAGIGIWVVVIVTLALLSVLVTILGGGDALPREAPPMVLWISHLPIWTRVAVCLSAGAFEEAFFRGFLQPRVGVLLSTVLFALAHLAYDQPFMLVGVTLLSLMFAGLVRWRQSIWAAVAAHAAFDLIQLLVVIPLVSRLFELEESLSTAISGL